MAPSAQRRVGVGDVLKLIWHQATPFIKRRLAAVLALVILASVLTAVSPLVLKFIIDRLSVLRHGGGTFSLTLVMLYVLTLWFARISNELRELVFGHVRQRIVSALSERMFEHVMYLPLRFHLDEQTGAVCQTLDNGLEGLRIILYHLVFTGVPVAVELGAVVVVLAGLVQPQIFWLFCGALSCYLVVFGYSAVKITAAARDASRARVESTAAMMDGLLNYETVKYFTAEPLVRERVAAALSRCELAWSAFYRRYAVNGLLTASVFAMFLAGTVLYATEEVERGRMTIGAFVVVNAYMLQIVRPVEMIGYAMQGLSQGTAMLEKLVLLFREPTELRVEQVRKKPIGAGSLVFQEVCLSYDGGRRVLQNLNFRITAGRTLGIVGPSGSGKSTVVRLLMRLLEPESGQILLDDEPISAMALHSLRSSIAVVPQDMGLFDDTLRYNIAFGHPRASSEEIEGAARIAQLHEFVMTLPAGYETVVGERGLKLSGGERQRIAIARAALKSPRIYVFDEATSCLDTATERAILCGIRRISKANTTLIIAHRLSTVVHADEIMVLENGQVAERGTHSSLLRREGRYAALWKAQQAGAAAASHER